MQVLEALSDILLRDGENAVLHSRFVSSRLSGRRTHMCVSDEVGELDDVARVRIDEHLVPHGLGFILDLCNI